MDPLSPSEQPIVLIVDDDTMLTNMFQQAMRKWNFQVMEANTGQVALTLLETQSVDLVMLDMTLPDQPGLSVAASLAQTHPSLPIVIATGHDPDPATLPPNVVEVVRKPFSLRNLGVRLQELLKRP